MKVGILGSVGIFVPPWHFMDCIPRETAGLVISDEPGIIEASADYADKRRGIVLYKVPQNKYDGFSAPFMQRTTIIELADEVVFFWDGVCPDMEWVHRVCKHRGKRLFIRVCR